MNLKKQSTASYQSNIKAILKVSQQYSASSESTGNQEEIIFENGIFWKIVNGKRKGPFCQVCKDDQNKWVHLIPDDVYDGSEMVRMWICKVCNNSQPY